LHPRMGQDLSHIKSLYRVEHGHFGEKVLELFGVD
jgi:hypothetical protein